MPEYGDKTITGFYLIKIQNICSCVRLKDPKNLWPPQPCKGFPGINCLGERAFQSKQRIKEITFLYIKESYKCLKEIIWNLGWMAKLHVHFGIFNFFP